MRRSLSPPTFLCPTFWGGRMLPDLPLHRVRLLLVPSAAGCSPFLPLLPFKPLFPGPQDPIGLWLGVEAQVLAVWAPASRYSDGPGGPPWAMETWMPSSFPNAGLWGRLVSPSLFCPPLLQADAPPPGPSSSALSPQFSLWLET